MYCKQLGDSKRSVSGEDQGISLVTSKAGAGRAGKREGGGGKSKQDVCDWNPESPLLRCYKILPGEHKQQQRNIEEPAISFPAPARITFLKKQPLKGCFTGAVSEWLKEAVLKTVVP